MTIAEPGLDENKGPLALRHLYFSTYFLGLIPPKSVVGDTETFADGSSPRHRIQSGGISGWRVHDGSRVYALHYGGSPEHRIGEHGRRRADFSKCHCEHIRLGRDRRDGPPALPRTPSGVWIAIQPETTTTDVADFTLSGLTPDTEYEVEVSLDNGFSLSKSTTFTTEAMTSRPPSPVVRVSGLFAEDITPSSVTVVALIAGPENQVTVNLRYRIQGTNTWSRTIRPDHRYGDRSIRAWRADSRY